jgi:sigma-B regulation protein RsbU (phosphoserine phosphatase)
MSQAPSAPAASSRRWAFLRWWPDGAWPISVRLLLAVNVPLGIALAVLLTLEYRREMREALSDASTSLREEAIAIHSAVGHLDGDATGTTQSFINEVCRKMEAVHLVNHRIVVIRGPNEVHSGAAGPQTSRSTDALIEAFRGSRSNLELEGNAVVFGGVDDRGIAVIVSEDANHIERIVRQKLATQLGMLALLGVVAAAIVNVVVIRMVSRPLQRMARTVDVIARGQFGGQVEPSNTLELMELATSVNSMSRALDAVEKLHCRMMQSAREIQEHLHPDEVMIPALAVLREYQPADDVGGDYYDVIPLADGSWLLVIADVAGHGVPAAMAAALLKALLLCASDHSHAPEEILRQVNRRFVSLLPAGRFVTVLLAAWHPQTRRLVYVNAGHPPGLVWNPRDGFRQLDSDALPVGIMDNVVYEPQELQLSDEDRMVWYTDGVLEVFSPSGELYGTERLKQVIVGNAGSSLEQLQSAILASVRAFAGGRAFADDLTLLVAGRGGNGK